MLTCAGCATAKMIARAMSSASRTLSIWLRIFSIPSTTIGLLVVALQLGVDPARLDAGHPDARRASASWRSDSEKPTTPDLVML